jgi:hypothetical protein
MMEPKCQETINAKSIQVLYGLKGKEITHIKDLPKNSSLKLLKLDSSTFPLLTKCLLCCIKIGQDFKIDLKKISSDSHLAIKKNAQNSNEIYVFNQNENINQKELFDLAQNYETNKLSLLTIDLTLYFSSNESIQGYVRYSNKDKFKKFLANSLRDNYGSENILQIELRDEKYLDLRGYSKAVNDVNDIILQSVYKKKNNQIDRILSCQYCTQKDPRFNVFFSFDGIYFQHLKKCLSQLNAKAIEDKKKESISIECLNKKLLEDEPLDEWRQTIEEFMKKYMKLFSHEMIKTPFTYTNPIVEEVTFNSRYLDVTWVGDQKVEVFGLKKDLNQFKANLNLIASSINL